MATAVADPTVVDVQTAGIEAADVDADTVRDETRGADVDVRERVDVPDRLVRGDAPDDFGVISFLDSRTCCSFQFFEVDSGTGSLQSMTQRVSTTKTSVRLLGVLALR